MALQLPQMPNFTAQTPDILGAQQKQATLSQMLNANALQKQLAPLQVQEQQEKAKAATLQNQVTQEDLNNQVAFGKMFLASEGDTNKLTEMISDPKQNFGLTPRGIGPALQQVIAHREAMYKMDEATAAHTDAKNNIVLPLLKQLDDATKQSDRIAIRGKLTEVMKSAGMFSPEEIAAAATMDLDDHTVGWNLAAHRSQKQLLDERKAASEEASSQGTLLRGQTMASEFAAKTDPNSPFYDPSAAYLAKRAAAGDPDAKAILAQQTKQAGAKAGAEAAAKFPWEARLEQMRQQGDPVFAWDPKNKQTVQVSRGEAQSGGMTNIVKVGQPEIDKAKTSAMQLGDATMNIAAYKIASQKMDELSGGDIATVSRVLGSDQFKAHFLGLELPVDWANKLYQTKGWTDMPESAKDAVVNYIAARPAAISLLRAINPGVRLTESQIATELKNIPDPTSPSDIREKQFQRLDRNIDQASKTLVRIPGVDLPSDIRDRLQEQATQTQNATAKNSARNAAASAAASGQYRNARGNTMRIGQEAYDSMTNRYIGKVSKVYPDKSYDVQP